MSLCVARGVGIPVGFCRVLYGGGVGAERVFIGF